MVWLCLNNINEYFLGRDSNRWSKFFLEFNRQVPWDSTLCLLNLPNKSNLGADNYQIGLIVQYLDKFYLQSVLLPGAAVIMLSKRKSADGMEGLNWPKITTTSLVKHCIFTILIKTCCFILSWQPQIIKLI